MPLLGGGMEGGKKKKVVKKKVAKRGAGMEGGAKKKANSWNKYVKAHFHAYKMKHPNLSNGEIFARLAVGYRK